MCTKFCNLQTAGRVNGDASSGHRNVNTRAKNSWRRFLGRGCFAAAIQRLPQRECAFGMAV